MLVRRTLGQAPAESSSIREMCLVPHAPNYPNELKGKALDA